MFKERGAEGVTHNAARHQGEAEQLSPDLRTWTRAVLRGESKAPPAPAPRELARMQRHLGLGVEVQCAGGGDLAAHTTAAFAAVVAIESLLSAGSKESDLARLNEAPVDAAVPVAPVTWSALARGLSLHSDGPVVSGMGAARAPSRRCPFAALAPVELLAGGSVVKRSPHTIDLAELLPAIAVDHAVTTLLGRGCDGGAVRIGATLRVFGSAIRRLWVRGSNTVAPIALLRNAAACTVGAERCDLPPEAAPTDRASSHVLLCSDRGAMTCIAPSALEALRVASAQLVHVDAAPARSLRGRAVFVRDHSRLLAAAGEACSITRIATPSQPG